MANLKSRRDWLRQAGLLVGAATAAAGAQRTTQPNVLLISIDDLNDWIGALGGHPQALTPNIDSLAERGVLFRRAYCQAPSCNPSRTSVLTGLRPSTSGVYGNGDLWRDALPNAVTLPQHFKSHGYEVLGGGKTFHAPQNDPASWHYYFNFPGFLNPVQKPANGLNSGHFDWSPVPAEDDETADTKVARWAGDYLRKKSSKPFFLACGFYRPHLPWYAPEKYFEKFPEAKTLLPAYLEGDLDDTPPSARRGLRDHDNVTSSGQWKRAVAAYLACIHYADANVGRVLEALDQGPNADNTIIVLWTDHGWQLGEKQQWRKFTLWERSTHVPLIVAGPGIRPGACERTVELLDIYPTLLDLADLPGRSELDGRSLRPLLEDPDAPWDRPAISSTAFNKHTVRTERWRYATFPDGEELYDHRHDPNEWTNLAADPEYADIRVKLAGLAPRNPSKKRIASWSDLNRTEKRLVELPAGLYHGSDANNDVGLPSTPPANRQ